MLASTTALLSRERQMKPMFVSFAGRKNGHEAQGWVVLDNQPYLSTGDDVAEITTRIEDLRRYDPGTLVIISFQRLEGDEQS